MNATDSDSTGDPITHSVAELFRQSGLAERVQVDYPLGPLCTYRVGGAAAHYVSIETIDELVELALIVHKSAAPTLVIGRGSNLLIADSGFDGIAFSLGSAFGDIAFEPASDSESSGELRTLMRAGAAASLPVAARASVAAGLTGFEWAVGVPGSVGGAIRMNAGGHGSDMAASVVQATIVDLHAGVASSWSPEELGFSYRRSAVLAHHVVVDVTLALDPGDKAASEAALSEIVRWRREHQPGGQNAGSVFTNPDGDSAGRLIDAAGGRGLRVGSAEVSTKHANFIQADPDGSADDIHALMQAVQQLVLDHHGVALLPETRLIGFDA